MMFMVRTALLNASVSIRLLTFVLEDAPHTGCSTTTDDDKLKALIETK